MGERLLIHSGLAVFGFVLHLLDLILQPLIENSLKHGVQPDGSPTHLRITARKEGRNLVLEVEDSGPGMSNVPGTGIGIANVRERLLARFGDRARVETNSRPGEGFLVRLKFPATTAARSEVEV